MQFQFDRLPVSGVISNVASIVKASHQLEIYTHLYCEVKDGVLAITASNADNIEITSKILLDPTLESVEGKFTLPAKKFNDICRTGLGDKVKVTLDGLQAKVQIGRNRATLQTLEAENFPLAFFDDPILTFELLATELFNLINATEFAMANKDARYFLNGLRLEFDSEQNLLMAVGTDGHRLSCKQIKTESLNQNLAIIIPRDTILKLKSTLKGFKENVKINVNAQSIAFMIGDTTIQSKLIDGRYPDYKRVLPRNIYHAYTVERDILLGLLNRMAILSTQQCISVKLSFKGNELTVSLKNDLQEVIEEVTDIFNDTNSDIDIAFNINYLRDALSTSESEQIVFGFADSQSAAQITPKAEKEGEETKFVIMPMRL